MTNFLDKVKALLHEKLNPEKILLIDNSKLHSKHRFFSPDKFHLKILIKSEKLKKMNKIQAHKMIYSTLKNEMKNKIHALEIEIE
tara:strand:- start:539 stop:793 length:255 start_codon:yes stop_codon:yes gene_type:complete